MGENIAHNDWRQWISKSTRKRGLFCLRQPATCACGEPKRRRHHGDDGRRSGRSLVDAVAVKRGSFHSRTSTAKEMVSAQEAPTTAQRNGIGRSVDPWIRGSSEAVLRTRMSVDLVVSVARHTQCYVLADLDLDMLALRRDLADLDDDGDNLGRRT